MFDHLPATRTSHVHGRGRAVALAAIAHVVILTPLFLSNALAVTPVAPPAIPVRFLAAAPPPVVEVELHRIRDVKKPPPRVDAQNAKLRMAPPRLAPVLTQPDLSSVAQVVKGTAVIEQVELQGSREETDEVVLLGSQSGQLGSGGNGGPGGEVNPETPLQVGGEVQAPVLIAQPTIRYPPLALAIRVQGEVLIEAVIDATGAVTSARVVDGPSALTTAALEAAYLHRYLPGRLRGVPVAVYFQLRVTFRLR